MSIRSFSFNTGLSGFSNTNNIAYSKSLDYSQATTTAIVAAQSILLTGCSEEIALNAAREAVKSILSPSGNFFERHRESFLHRRKIKQQADAIAWLALSAALSNLRKESLSSNSIVHYDNPEKVEYSEDLACYILPPSQNKYQLPTNTIFGEISNRAVRVVDVDPSIFTKTSSTSTKSTSTHVSEDGDIEVSAQSSRIIDIDLSQSSITSTSSKSKKVISTSTHVSEDGDIEVSAQSSRMIDIDLSQSSIASTSSKSEKMISTNTHVSEHGDIEISAQSLSWLTSDLPKSKSSEPSIPISKSEIEVSSAHSKYESFRLFGKVKSFLNRGQTSDLVETASTPGTKEEPDDLNDQNVLSTRDEMNTHVSTDGDIVEVSAQSSPMIDIDLSPETKEEPDDLNDQNVLSTRDEMNTHVSADGDIVEVSAQSSRMIDIDLSQSSIASTSSKSEKMISTNTHVSEHGDIEISAQSLSLLTSDLPKSKSSEPSIPISKSEIEVSSAHSKYESFRLFGKVKSFVNVLGLGLTTLTSDLVETTSTPETKEEPDDLNDQNVLSTRDEMNTIVKDDIQESEEKDNDVNDDSTEYTLDASSEEEISVSEGKIKGKMSALGRAMEKAVMEAKKKKSKKKKSKEKEVDITKSICLEVVYESGRRVREGKKVTNKRRYPKLPKLSKLLVRKG